MFEDAQRWLPSLLVVLGWIVVNHQNDKREGRKETRSLIDGAKAAVTKLASSAVSYHVEGKVELAYEIKAGLETLEIECERLPNYVKGCPLMHCLAEFADAMTGGDFESSEVKPKTLTSPEVLTIQRTRTAMIAELERVFRVHYLGLGGSSNSKR